MESLQIKKNKYATGRPPVSLRLLPTGLSRGGSNFRTLNTKFNYLTLNVKYFGITFGAHFYNPYFKKLYIKNATGGF